MPKYTLAFFVPLAAIAVGSLFIQRPEAVIAQEAQAQGAKPADHGSYFIGYNFGSSLGSDGFTEADIKQADFIAGMIDGLKQVEPRLSDEELQAAQKQIVEALQNRAQKQAEENSAKAKAFLEENKSADGVQTLAEGLQFKVLETGSGPSPKLTDTVSVHYEGKLLNGQVFDSSYQRGEPAEFPANAVIKGWSLALQRMKVGDKWRLFIPPGLAYGPAGSAPAIGPNELLIFDVELLGIK